MHILFTSPREAHVVLTRPEIILRVGYKILSSGTFKREVFQNSRIPIRCSTDTRRLALLLQIKTEDFKTRISRILIQYYQEIIWNCTC